MPDVAPTNPYCRTRPEANAYPCVPALRTAGNWLGLARGATQSVQVAVGATADLNEPLQPTESDIEELMQQRAELQDIMNRYLPVEYLVRERDQLDAAIASRQAGLEPEQGPGFGSGGVFDGFIGDAADAQESPQSDEYPTHPRKTHRAP